MRPNETMRVTIATNKDVKQIIRAKEGDAQSRYLELTLVNDMGIAHDLTDCVVLFNAKKFDGTYIFNNTKILDAANGVALVELTDQALTTDGRDRELWVDISIESVDGTAILTTREFRIAVQTTIRNDTAIESSNEFGAVVTLFQDVYDMREVIRSIDDKIGNKNDDADIVGDEDGNLADASVSGKMNRFWNYMKTQSTAAIVGVVNMILSLIGNSTDTGTDTVMGKLNASAAENAAQMRQYLFSPYIVRKPSFVGMVAGIRTQVVDVQGVGVLIASQSHSGRIEIVVDGEEIIDITTTSTASNASVVIGNPNPSIQAIGPIYYTEIPTNEPAVSGTGIYRAIVSPILFEESLEVYFTPNIDNRRVDVAYGLYR